MYFLPISSTLLFVAIYGRRVQIHRRHKPSQDSVHLHHCTESSSELVHCLTHFDDSVSTARLELSTLSKALAGFLTKSLGADPTAGWQVHSAGHILDRTMNIRSGNPKGLVTTDAPLNTLLTWPIHRLAEAAGGEVGARHVWQLLRHGIDPADAWSQDGQAVSTASQHRINASSRIDLAFASPSMTAQLVKEAVALDGTRKLLLQMRDGAEIETVLIPPLPAANASGAPVKRAANARAHTTLCISSQVGCARGCSFCATGRMGLVRNLTADEILVQAFIAKAVVSRTAMPPLTNIVFMGMGEPSDNIDEVRTALSCLTDRQRFAFARRKVYVSTVAPRAAAFDALLQPLLPGLQRGRVEDVDTAPVLAWSLHAADSKLRKRLVPTATESPDVLRQALCEALSLREPRHRRVLIECALVAGVNDRPEDAEALATFLKPLEAACYDPNRQSNRTGILVNLIPFNPPASPTFSSNTSMPLQPSSFSPSRLPDYKTFRRPSRASVEVFKAILKDHGVWVSVRASRGDDTMSACGQLATETKRRRRQQQQQPRIESASVKHRLPQWERLVESSSPGSYRCCLICEGSGRVRKRNRKSRRRQSNTTFRASGSSANSAAPFASSIHMKNLVPCPACAGVGILPSPTLSPPSANMTVAIIGAGIAGLALALALQQRNMSCVVFERDASFGERAQGYGLTLQQGSRAIYALGLSRDVAEAGLLSASHLCFDAVTGNLIGSLGAASRGDVGAKGGLASDADEESLKKRNIHLPRQSLRALLFRRLRPGTVRWNSRFIGASFFNASLPHDGLLASGVELHFSRRHSSQQHSTQAGHHEREDEEIVRASVLVGCDGIRSAVRQALTTDSAPKLRSLEVMVILGFAVTRHEDMLFANNDKVVEWVDGDSRLYTMPFEQGLTMWQLSFPYKAEDGHTLAHKGKLELLAEAQRRTEGWPRPAVRLLNITDSDIVTGYPCYDCEVGNAASAHSDKEHSERGVLDLSSCAAIIGDAIHPMAPFKGQGANQALLDAIELARALYDSEIGDEAARENAANVRSMAAGDATPPDADRRLSQRQLHRSRQPLIAALRDYEQISMPRATRKVLASRKATEMLHSPFARAVSNVSLTRAAAASAAAAAQEVDG